MEGVRFRAEGCFVGIYVSVIGTYIPFGFRFGLCAGDGRLGVRQCQMVGCLPDKGVPAIFAEGPYLSRGCDME